jgi:hypothetical protein
VPTSSPDGRGHRRPDPQSARNTLISLTASAAVYGEEYRLADAEQVVEAIRAGRPIPATPQHAP